MTQQSATGEKTKATCAKIVFMGDSITYGQYVEPSFRWTDLLADRLTRRYLDTPVNLFFVNKGISGETTRQGLERFAADVQAIQPDIMTLQFGLNDANYWVTDRGLPRVSLVAYRANLVEMIERARRFGTKHILLMTSHATLRNKVLMGDVSLEASRKVYNEALRSVAEETKVTLCDIDKEFSNFSFKELEDMLLPYPDHLHLSIKGHSLYADLLIQALEFALQSFLEGDGGKNGNTH